MLFKYVAYTDRDELVKGKLTASDEDAAQELLEYAGYRAVSIKKYVPFFSSDKFMDSLFKIKPNDVVMFYRQLAMLLESGNDITSCLEILKNQTDSRPFRKVVNDIIADVREGSQLSASIKKHPEIFSSMHSRMVSIGEQSGNLDTVLVQIADDMEKELATSKETKNALMYPVVTLVITVIVVSVLLVFVLPSFSRLYESLGVELPSITKGLLAMSQFVRANWMPIFALMASAAAGLFLYLRTKKGRFNRDRFLLKIPYLGKVRHLVELSRCCRSLSVLFSAGLSLTEAVPLIGQSCNNQAIASGFQDIHQKMMKGEGLSRPMSENRFFLPLMTQMVRVGEETGNLENTLMTVSRTYSAEAEYKLKSLIAMIQPTMTVVIGMIIALLALSMTSALYGIYGRGI